MRWILCLLITLMVALPGWAQSNEAWQIRFRNEANAVRLLEMTPREWTKPKRRLILFATPNGNTLEQSFGARAKAERDWHFDIQHIGAQFRYAQSQSPDVDMALVILQAGQLSWPAFRQSTDGADKQIGRLVERLQTEFRADETYLTCHSGGGSFIWGWMNFHEQLPSTVRRIAFLDANYSYSDELQHGDKLLSWLRASDDAHLLVMAYDDRNVEYLGKKVVSEDGGTYRASQRMLNRMDKEERGQRDPIGDWQSIRYLNGRAQYWLHSNPKNSILHTAMVGEMNGFAWACLTGQADAAGRVNAAEQLLSGPRCYGDQIDDEPIREATRQRARVLTDVPVQFMNLPPRSAAAETGTAFVERMASLERTEREQAILTAIREGNLPTWSRRLLPIEITVRADNGKSDSKPAAKPGAELDAKSEVRLRLTVQQDYLAIGSDEDAVRIPMTPATAWQIGELLNCSLPTTRLCDDIFDAAPLHVNPRPMTKDRDRWATFLEHDRLIEQQLKGKSRESLVAGHKKDLVISNELLKKEHRVAIYGWHYPSGVAIQPLYAGHVDWYTDYSHGVRMISNVVEIDGQVRDYRDLLRSDSTNGWLSNEGAIEIDKLRPKELIKN